MRAGSVDELRLLVVARVRETALESLEKRAQDSDVRAAEEAAAAASEASTHARSTSSDGGGNPATEHLKAAAEHTELEAWLRSEEARGEAEARCAAMARPGTAMGGDELQALADFRGACVQVRGLVCVLGSSDHGELLRPRNHMPAPKQYLPGGGGGDCLLGSVGKAYTLRVLL